MLKPFNIRPLSEDDISSIIASAGGKLAYPDVVNHSQLNADYLFANSIIELKALDEEGFGKTPRQEKLAELFLKVTPDRPVVVLDKEVLNSTQKRQYYRIIERPIKSAVNKANKQLKQSRIDFRSAESSVLFILNNGYTGLDHDELKKIVTHRVRQDTSKIDGIIVAGCYYYSDGFDSYFMWPIDYIPIRGNITPESYTKLKRAWDAFSEKFMTDVVQGKIDDNVEKGAVKDLVFDVDGVKFVKPAPPMGSPSDFYKNSRPRENTTGIDICPPVAFTIPTLTKTQWKKIRTELDVIDSNFQSYEKWKAFYNKALSSAVSLRPIVPISFDIGKWVKWCKTEHRLANYPNLAQYVTEKYQLQIGEVIEKTCKFSEDETLSKPFIMVLTEEIGQDKANDVSHIYQIRPNLKTDKKIVPICLNLRIFHEHAIALASAYALKNGIETVRWLKDGKYTWQ